MIENLDYILMINILFHNKINVYRVPKCWVKQDIPNTSRAPKVFIPPKGLHILSPSTTLPFCERYCPRVTSERLRWNSSEHRMIMLRNIPQFEELMFRAPSLYFLRDGENSKHEQSVINKCYPQGSNSNNNLPRANINHLHIYMDIIIDLYM